MASKFLLANANKNKSVVSRTLEHEGIFDVKGLSMRQQFDHGLFASQACKPGQKTSIEVKFNSKDIELDRQWFIRFNMATSDATNHGTFFADCYTLIDFLELEINDSREKWTFDKNYKLRLQRGDMIKQQGDKIYEYRAESMDCEFNAIAGITVTDSAEQVFHFNLFEAFPQFKDQVMQGLIQSMKITLRFTPAPSNAKDCGEICVSNTTSSPYAVSTITFDDITFVRVFDIVRDPATYLRPSLDTVQFLVPYYEEKVYSSEAWNTVGATDSITFSLQDVFKMQNVQKLQVFVRKNSTAYNTSTGSRLYSGYKYIKWSVKELDGDRDELSFLATTPDSTARLRAHEITKQFECYGCHLPIEVHADTTHLNKYFVGPMTEIHFNHIEVSDNAYDVICNLDTAKKYYSVTLECAGAIGTDCDVVVVAMAYDKYTMANNGKLVKLT